MTATRWLAFLVAMCLWAGVSTRAHATVTFTFTDTVNPHYASATFTKSGSILVIALTNTYMAASTFQFQQTDVLTGLFFDVTGKPTLTAGTALVSSGSVIRLNGANITATETSSLLSAPHGMGDVGSAWAYKQGITEVSQNYGLGASGFSSFGKMDLFNPEPPFSPLPHQNGTPPDGVDYGLMPGVTTNYTHASFSSLAFIQTSVTFTLSGFAGSESDIGDIRFQYGTATSEYSGTPGGPAVPGPSTIVIALSGFAAIGLGAIRRFKRRAVMIAVG